MKDIAAIVLLIFALCVQIAMLCEIDEFIEADVKFKLNTKEINYHDSILIAVRRNTELLSGTNSIVLKGLVKHHQKIMTKLSEKPKEKKGWFRR